MRAARALVLLLVAAVSVGLPAAAASAEEYPPTTPSLTAIPGTIIAGDTTTVVGRNYGPNDLVTLAVTTNTNALKPGETVLVPVAYSAARQTVVQADVNGSFSAVLTLTTPGLATIVGNGSPSGRSASTTVRVLPVGAALPTTGGDTNYLTVALIGSAIAAAGVLLVVMTRTRRLRLRQKSL
jgi:LPXTG-motif cell wall-anchored protein